MATRIDIEITSDRGDGTLTWRAAGAKQPKGVVDASLLPDGASVGDVLRAEAEFTVDGPELVSLTATKSERSDGIERLELLGSGSSGGGVTTDLAKKPRRGDREGRRRGRDRDGRPPRSGGDRRGGRRPAPIRAGRTHREAWIASLPENRRAVAEQLMHEGRDGVRAALERQNAAAAADGRDPIDIAPIMRIADELAPGLEAAEWKDRADAMLASVDSADLRELRKSYLGGTARIDDDLLSNVRTKLAARIDREQSQWLREVREALAEGRVVRALQKSGRPVKAGMPLPDDVVDQLCAATNEALDPEEEPSRWVAVVEALAGSPVRRLIRPGAIPEQRDDELLDTVERVAHLVPGVAEAFGVDPKPPRRTRSRSG